MALRSGFARLLCKQADAGLQLTKQAHSVALVGAPLSRGQVGSAARGGEAPLAPPREQAGAAAARLGSARLPSAGLANASLFSLSRRNGGEWITAPRPSAPRGWWSGWPGSVRHGAAPGASPAERGLGGGCGGGLPGCLHLPPSRAGQPFHGAFRRSVTQPLAASPGGGEGEVETVPSVSHETQNAGEPPVPGGKAMPAVFLPYREREACRAPACAWPRAAAAVGPPRERRAAPAASRGRPEQRGAGAAGSPTAAFCGRPVSAALAHRALYRHVERVPLPRRVEKSGGETRGRLRCSLCSVYAAKQHP